MTTIQFTPENENIRLDQYLSSELQDFSRTHIQKLIKMGFVLVNGTIRKPGFRLFGGENIKVELPDENPVPEILKPENIPLKIVFEDDAIVVLDKPAGLV
ncbi:MAG TPA: RluA family pseudouridine synthase, partial [Candidatus Marinimicrobia bacterium]|nr:RluA family pseudouridine synthase [Candidatus Neomarinimicrobiota bacterium]